MSRQLHQSPYDSYESDSETSASVHFTDATLNQSHFNDHCPTLYSFFVGDDQTNNGDTHE